MAYELLNDVDIILIEYLKKTYPHYSKLVGKPDRRYIHCNVLGITPEAAAEFNKIISWIMQSDIAEYRLSRTERNCLSKEHSKYYGCGWDIEVTDYSVELIVVYEGMWKIRFATDAKKETGISGRDALNWFKKECLKYGINLDDYAIDDGIEVKKTIESYMIKWGDTFKDSIAGHTIEGVHHIDFHNSFPAGLVNTHPEFYNVVNDLFLKRHLDEIYKAVLNLSIGAFQSIGLNGACWAHLSRDAIADNNKRVRELSDMLIAAGRIPLAYNTDGIWYKGEVFHGEGEGPALGQWENDHINCKIRFKSKGCYEFEENGEYYPVVRGKCYLDRIKSRKEWVWGDIFKEEAIPFAYKFDWEQMKLIQIKGDEIDNEPDISGL